MLSLALKILRMLPGRLVIRDSAGPAIGKRQ